MVQMAPENGSDAGAGATGLNPVSSSAGVDINVTPDPAPELPTFSIPDEYKDKPYIQNLLKNENPNAEFFKQFDNLQSMLGKPKGVPSEDAPDSDWDAYYNSVRPESKDLYDIPLLTAAEGAPDTDKKIIEHLNSQRDDAFIDQVRDILYSEGLTKRQAQNIAKKYDEMLFNSIKADVQKNLETQAALNQEFDSFASQVLGGADITTATTKARETLAPLVSEKGRPFLEKISDNAAAVVLLDIGNQVRQKYLKEDSRIPGENIAQGGDEKSLRQKARELMATPEYADPMNTKYEAVHAQVDSLYDQIRKLK